MYNMIIAWGFSGPNDFNTKVEMNPERMNNIYASLLEYQKVNPEMRKTHFKRDGQTKKEKKDQERKILLSSQTLMADLWCLKPTRPNDKVATHGLENVGAAVSFPKNVKRALQTLQRFLRASQGGYELVRR